MELPEPHSCRYLTNDFTLHLSKNVIICKKRKDSPTAIETIFKNVYFKVNTHFKYTFFPKENQGGNVYGKRCFIYR